MKTQFPYIVFVDAGHGGIDPKTGKYVTAPDKMNVFDRGEFHNGPEFYEGVSNREIASLFMKELRKEEIPYLQVYHDWEDTRLSARTALINHYHAHIKKGILISLHSNWFVDKSVRGFQTHTSIGQTQSDLLAEQMWINVEKRVDRIVMRYQDWEDGDHDYENNFYMLKKTNCPAILNEMLFFSNYEDAHLLLQWRTQQQYVDALMDTVIWAQKNLVL